MKAFSRKREFEADKLAAELLDKKSMISALETLQKEVDSIDYSNQVAGYAALKISSPQSRLGSYTSLFSQQAMLHRLDSISVMCLSKNTPNQALHFV